MQLIKTIFIYAIAALILSFAFTQVILVSENNIGGRTAWEAPRAQINFPYESFNARKFESDLISLAQGRLNLGAWHGHQVLLTKSPYNIDKIKIKFQLAEESVLYLALVDDENNESGIRISNTEFFTPMKYRAAPNGKFTEKIKHGEILNTQWQTKEFNLNEFPGVDTKKSYRLKFRSEYLPVRIDGVQLLNSKGEKEFAEEFYWSEKYDRYLLRLFIFIFLFSLALHRTARVGFLLPYLTFCLAAVAVSFLIWAAFFFHFSLRYPIADSKFAPPKTEVFHKWRSKISADQNIYLRYSKRKNFADAVKKTERILFLGSSQTFGEGTSGLKFTWAYQYCENLNEKLNKEIKCENLARKGARSPHMVEELQKSQPTARDLIFFVMGNNDRMAINFQNGVDGILKSAQEAGATLFIVFEANDPQVNSESLSANHRILKTACENSDLTCFDMHSYLMTGERFDSGHMWNDHVHATDYTQELMAEALLNATYKVLKPK